MSLSDMFFIYVCIGAIFALNQDIKEGVDADLKEKGIPDLPSTRYPSYIATAVVSALLWPINLILFAIDLIVGLKDKGES